MKTILGIDPGLLHTGYGIIQTSGTKFKHLTHGVIKTDSNNSHGKRLEGIYDSLKRLIQKYKPDEAGIETLYFAKNVKSAIPVSEARGVIILCLQKNKIYFAEYTPLVIKQTLIGNGRAEKSQVKEMIKIIFGLKELIKEDHAADALATAFCHSSHCKTKELYLSGKK